MQSNFIQSKQPVGLKSLLISTCQLMNKHPEMPCLVVPPARLTSNILPSLGRGEFCGGIFFVLGPSSVLNLADYGKIIIAGFLNLTYLR